MGRIKSALEIALERTESVKGDRTAAGQFDARQQGKKLANAFLAGEIPSLENEIRKADRDTRGNLRQGIFDALVSQVALPSAEGEQKRIEAAGKGLAQVINDGRFNDLFRQFLQVVSRYAGEAKRLDEAIRSQYAPRLRQKEEELSRRLGSDVTINPFQDPEFLAVYNKNLNALRENYQAVVDQVREQASLFFAGDEP